MSLHHEARPSVTNQSNPELPTETSPEAPKKSRRNMFIGLGSGAAALALAGGIFAGVGHSNSPEKTAPKSNPVATAPTTPGASESPVTASTSPTTPETGAASDKTQDPNLYKGRVNPETLVNMTHEQLLQAAQITKEEAPTPDIFAKLYIQHIETWANAGSTPEEAAKYSNDPSGYEQAMGDRYDGAFAEGLYGADFQNQPDQAAVLAADHHTFLQRYYGSYASGGPNQNVHLEYKDYSIVKSFTDGSFVLKIDTTFSDNYGEGLSFPDMKPFQHDGSIQIAYGDRNGDGVYEATVNNYDLYGNISSY